MSSDFLSKNLPTTISINYDPECDKFKVEIKQGDGRNNAAGTFAKEEEIEEALNKFLVALMMDF